jgi:hypothetical protein
LCALLPFDLLAVLELYDGGVVINFMFGADISVGKTVDFSEFEIVISCKGIKTVIVIILLCSKRFGCIVEFV